MARKSVPFVVLVGAATLIGLAILSSPAEDVYGPGPPHAGGLGEEIDRGNIAYEIEHGPLLDVLDYQWAPFFGGSLVMGIAAVPFFALLAPNSRGRPANSPNFRFCALDRETRPVLRGLAWGREQERTSRAVPRWVA